VTRIATLLMAAALVALMLGDAPAQQPTPDPAPLPKPGCVTVHGAGDSGIYVNLSNEASPAAIAHIRDAVARGKARILHWAPELADVHRKAALRGVATRAGFDRDEYPPAASFEGGAGSDVRLIPSADNRSAGQRLGVVMRPYCTGQAFIVEP